MIFSKWRFPRSIEETSIKETIRLLNFKASTVLHIEEDECSYQSERGISSWCVCDGVERMVCYNTGSPTF